MATAPENGTVSNYDSLSPEEKVLMDRALEEARKKRAGGNAVTFPIISTEEMAESESIQPPKRLTDDIFRTVKGIRDAVHTSLGSNGDLDIFIPMEKGAPDEGGDLRELGVRRSLLVSLIASARVALRWKMTEQDPVASGVTFAEELLKDIPPRIAKLDELRGKNRLFEGVDPLCADDDLVEILEERLASIPETVVAPTEKRKQHYYVEQYSTQDEQVHIAAIVRAMLSRSRDLHSMNDVNSPDSTRAELRAWMNWQSKINTKQLIPHAQAMLDIYQSVMVNKGDLLALTGMPAAVDQARRHIETTGGFLHQPSLEEINTMLQTHHSFLARDNNQPLGYTSVMTDREAVNQALMDMCGYNPAVTYVSKNLPKVNAQGGKVEWLKRTFVAEVLNSAAYLANSIEVAVRPTYSVNSEGGTQTLRSTGLATALKRVAYKDALEAGKSNIIVRHFEIVAVNGKQLQTSVMNTASRRFILALGGEEMGTYEETFSPMPDIKLKVLWHLFACDLKKAVETIDLFSK